MDRYKQLLAFIKPYKMRLALGVVCMIVAALGYLVVPWLIRNVVDGVLQNKDLGLLTLIVIAILIIFLIRGFATYGQNYMMAYVGQRVVIDIRETLFKHLQRLDQAYFDTRKTGVIMSNITSDVGALQQAIVDTLISFMTEGVTLVDWKLSLLTLIIVPVVLGLTNVFGKRLRSAGHEVQGRTADITAFLQEVISGARVIRSFARESFEFKRFEKENKNNFDAAMKATKLTAIMGPMVEFSAAIAVVVILWYGGYSVVQGYITAGSLIAFLIYAINLANPVKRLTQVYGNIQKALAAGDRVIDILETQPHVKELPTAKRMDHVKGEVHFDNVQFSYDAENLALKGVTLHVKPGETVAIVGPSGAGKSTIANLLPRFYDVTGGSIRIDGMDIREATFTSLRENIGLVPQDTMLFNASVRDNILYGRLDATDEEVLAAAKAANAIEFIEKLPQGFDTMVGERGNSLSGGQRQRIAIARAILKNPSILILDEATSALDTESEKIVQEALERLMKGRTALVIAHRLSTVQHADHIVVLQQGSVVEEGTHDELLALQGLYSHLYTVQFSAKG